MEPYHTHSDVLVIGGGPAGSATATRLAQSGHSVTLLEKNYHPRFHIGESLLPLSIPYLEALGVLDEVDAIGVRKYAAEFHSMYHGRHVSFQFGEALRDDYPYAYEVQRSEFDEILIRKAQKTGVNVLEGYRVDQAEITNNTINRVSAVGPDGERKSFSAQFYVDASGRDTFMADLLGIKRKNPRHKSAAVYAHFKGASRNSGKEEGNIAIYWFDHGWFWMIPLKGDVMSVGAVLKPDYLKSRTVPLETFLSDTIAMAPGVQKKLEMAERVSPVTGTGNYSYRSEKMSGKNYLLVGDAYAFIDPVFSSGVHLALHGAFKASEAITLALKSPKQSKQVIRNYEREIQGGLNLFAWFIYRVTSPAIRDLFMNPRDFFGMRRGIISVLAGDLFRDTPLKVPLFAFRLVYRLKSLFMKVGLSKPITN